MFVGHRAVLERYDAGYFDMWRTDKYTAPENPLPDTFAGVANFLDVVDTLIDSRPGFRYEDCGNGGHFKGLALARRFTFVTTNDNAPNVTMYRQTHYVNVRFCQTCFARAPPSCICVCLTAVLFWCTDTRAQSASAEVRHVLLEC